MHVLILVLKLWDMSIHFTVKTTNGRSEVTPHSKAERRLGRDPAELSPQVYVPIRVYYFLLQKFEKDRINA